MYIFFCFIDNDSICMPCNNAYEHSIFSLMILISHINISVATSLWYQYIVCFIYWIPKFKRLLFPQINLYSNKLDISPLV